jgi:hypothetical protein
MCIRDITYTYQWLQNGNVISGQTDQTLTLSAVASIKAGDTFSVEVTPSDGVILGNTFTSNTVTVATAKPITFGPVTTSVLINTDSTTNTKTLTVTPTSTDPNGETVNYTYQWLQNGTAISGATGQSLDLTKLTVKQGDVFTVKVTPADATATGVVFTSAAATVNSAGASGITIQLPAITSLTVNPDNATSATTLTAQLTTTDPYGRTVNFTYEWFQNGTAISGQTGQTLDLTKLTVKQDDVFTVQVTPNDGTLVGAAVTSGSVKATSVGPIVIGLPVVDSVSITPDNAANVAKLTAAPVSHDGSGNSSITYSYQWLHNGQVITGNTSATTATLTLSGIVVHVGDTFSVEVTPDDGTLDGNQFTSSTVTVATVSPITLS